MNSYPELRRLQERLKQIREYLGDISPKTTRYKQLKVEEKDILKKIGKLAV